VGNPLPLSCAAAFDDWPAGAGAGSEGFSGGLIASFTFFLMKPPI
jgi:hypothetical protein